MTSKRRVRRNECGSKIRYASRAEAVRAIHRTDHGNQAYICSFCKSWHIGHETHATKSWRFINA